MNCYYQNNSHGRFDNNQFLKQLNDDPSAPRFISSAVGKNSMYQNVITSD